jgi:acetoin utilization protein AcuB
MPAVDAQRLMAEARIRRLPVVGDGKRLLGLVTRQSLLVDPGKLGSLNMWDIASYLSGLTLKDVMLKAVDVVTVGPDLTIEEAARIMVEKKIGCLPVLEDGVVIGIITETDLLAQLASMMDLRCPGVRATVRMPTDLRGGLARLVDAVAAKGWGINALGGSVYPKDPAQWDAVIKIEGVTKEEMIAVLKQVEGEAIIDVREV